MKSWNIDPTTGDYVIENGVPVETDNLQVPAYIRVKTKRNQWMYAPNKQFGSNLFLIKRNQSSKTARAVEQATIEALQPILDDGRAEIINVETKEAARHGLGIEINILDNAGSTEQFSFDGLGV